MAEVHQVPEFGPMSGSTGRRKKYKKLALLGAMAKAKAAQTVLAPLLAISAVGIITVAAVENSMMNALPDSPAQLVWQDGGGQSQGNPPANAPDNPKAPENPKEPEKPKPPVKKPEVSSPPSSPPTDPPPTDQPPTDPPPSGAPIIDPGPGEPDTPPSPPSVTTPPPSVTTPPPSVTTPPPEVTTPPPEVTTPPPTDPEATGTSGTCELSGSTAIITGHYHIDLGSTTGAKVSAVVMLDGTQLTAGSWNPDSLVAITESGDYTITFTSSEGATVSAGTSLSMVLTVTFEPGGTTQTITIPITIPAPPFVKPTVTGVHVEAPGDAIVRYSYTITLNSASSATVKAVAAIPGYDPRENTVTHETSGTTEEFDIQFADLAGDFSGTLTLTLTYEQDGVTKTETVGPLDFSYEEPFDDPDLTRNDASLDYEPGYSRVTFHFNFTLDLNSAASATVRVVASIPGSQTEPEELDYGSVDGPGSETLEDLGGDGLSVFYCGPAPENSTDPPTGLTGLLTFYITYDKKGTETTLERSFNVS